MTLRRNRTTMRKVLLGLIFAVLMVPTALRGDIFAGTWKLNLAKSKDSVDHPRLPKSEIITVEEQDNGIKVFVDQVTPQGKSVQYRYSAKFDGKEYPVTAVTGPSPVDTVVMKRIDANTIEVMNKKGNVGTLVRSVFSPDGKTRTSTLTETDDKTGTANRVGVFDKQ
jgi:hypothetical protein